MESVEYTHTNPWEGGGADHLKKKVKKKYGRTRWSVYFFFHRLFIIT